jgi:hypothetical protein
MYLHKTKHSKHIASTKTGIIKGLVTTEQRQQRLPKRQRKGSSRGQRCCKGTSPTTSGASRKATTTIRIKSTTICSTESWCKPSSSIVVTRWSMGRWSPILRVDIIGQASWRRRCISLFGRQILSWISLLSHVRLSLTVWSPPTDKTTPTPVGVSHYVDLRWLLANFPGTC